MMPLSGQPCAVPGVAPPPRPGEAPLPLSDLNDFATHHIGLSGENLRAALLASAAIPMVLEGVRDLPGGPAGVYRDGGLLDYHLDLPYTAPGVILYPHFIDRVVPGWFDKTIPWRKHNAEQLRDVLLLCALQALDAGAQFQDPRFFRQGQHRPVGHAALHRPARQSLHQPRRPGLCRLPRDHGARL